MKQLAVFSLIIFFCLDPTFAQQNSGWTAFWNKDKTLIGFKDQQGNVKITPQFVYVEPGTKLNQTIGVTKSINGKLEDYYLSKTGKLFGKNSVFYLDNSPDYGSEGFVRFRDRVTKKVGMFDSKGDVAIPAVYDFLMPVRNGMVMASKGGKWDAKQISEHNQYPWVGSKELLIDIHNKVLIPNFPINEDLNFHSLNISKQPTKNPVRVNFKAANGLYYSFIDFNKEFRAWLKDSLLTELTKPNLFKFVYKKVQFCKTGRDCITEAKNVFFNKHFEVLISKLAAIKSSKSGYNIFNEELDQYEYPNASWGLDKYYDVNGMAKYWIYPVKNVVIDNRSYQDQLSFLRTELGYKLIQVTTVYK